MSERGTNVDERDDQADGGQGGMTSEGSEAARVREVVGRRGYDEAEDETESEDEEH